MEKVRFRNDRHVITSEWKLLLGSMGGMIGTATLCLFRLGAIAICWANRANLGFHESREVVEGKNADRAQKSERRVGMGLNGLLRSGNTSKVPDHHSEK
jgi:hypothetical protein